MLTDSRTISPHDFGPGLLCGLCLCQAGGSGVPETTPPTPLPGCSGTPTSSNLLRSRKHRTSLVPLSGSRADFRGASSWGSRLSRRLAGSWAPESRPIPSLASCEAGTCPWAPDRFPAAESRLASCEAGTFFGACSWAPDQFQSSLLGHPTDHDCQPMMVPQQPISRRRARTGGRGAPSAGPPPGSWAPDNVCQPMNRP